MARDLSFNKGKLMKIEIIKIIMMGLITVSLLAVASTMNTISTVVLMKQCQVDAQMQTLQDDNAHWNKRMESMCMTVDNTLRQIYETKRKRSK